MSDPAEDETGRNIVLEPLPTGMWQVLLGAITAVLGPLFGFLVGSMVGVGDSERPVNAMYLALFVGIVVGGIGAIIALLGALRLLRARARDTADLT